MAPLKPPQFARGDIEVVANLKMLGLEFEVNEWWLCSPGDRHASRLPILLEGHCPCGGRLHPVKDGALQCPQEHGYYRLCRAHQPPCIAWSKDGKFAEACPRPISDYPDVRTITRVEALP